MKLKQRFFNFWDKLSQTKKTILSLCIALIVIVLIVLIGIFYLTEKDKNISVRNAAYSNLTDSAFTVTWISDTKYAGDLIYQQGNNWPMVFAQSNKTHAYDDRDVEINNQGQFVQVAGGLKLRYTHIVTIRNLSPKIEYSVRLAGAINGKDLDLGLIKTNQIVADLKTPDPAYGKITGVDVSDSYIVINDNKAPEDHNRDVSVAISPSSTYSIDLNGTGLTNIKGSDLTAYIYSNNSKISRFNYHQDAYKPLETIALQSPPVGMIHNFSSPIYAGDGKGVCGGGVDVNSPQSFYTTQGVNKRVGPGTSSKINGQIAANQFYSTSITCVPDSDSVSGCPSNEWAKSDVYYVCSDYLISKENTTQQQDQAAINSGQQAAPIAEGSGPILDNNTLVPGGFDCSVPKNQCWTGASGNCNICLSFPPDLKLQGAHWHNNRCTQTELSASNCQTTSQGNTEVPITTLSTAMDQEAQGITDMVYSNITAPNQIDQVCLGGLDVNNGQIKYIHSQLITKGFKYLVSLSAQRIYFDKSDDCPKTSSDEKLLPKGYTLPPNANSNAPESIQVNVKYKSVKPSTDYPKYATISNCSQIITNDSVVAIAAANDISGTGHYDKAALRIYFNAYSLCEGVGDLNLAELLDVPIKGADGDQVKAGSVAIAFFNYSVYHDATVNADITVSKYDKCNIITPDSSIMKEIVKEHSDGLDKIIGDGSNFDYDTTPADGGGTYTTRIYLATKIVACDKNREQYFLNWTKEKKLHPDIKINGQINDLQNSLTSDIHALTNLKTIPTQTKSQAKSQPKPQPVAQVLGVSDQPIPSLSVTQSGQIAFFQNGQKVAQKAIVVNNGKVEVRMFVDKNGNGIKDADEPYLTDYSTITFSKTASIQQYSLNAGWNLINLPLIDTSTNGVATAKDLLDSWNSQHANIVHIARYRNGKFEIYSKREDGTQYSPNFDLVPGEPLYVLNLDKNAIVTYAGNSFTQSVPVELDNGWNLVGIIPSAGTTYNSESLLKKITDSGVQADTVSDFNNGIYQSVIVNSGTLFGNNFNVISTKGYFIKVESNGGKNFIP